MRPATLFTFYVLLFTFLVGCDRIDGRVTEGERADRAYQAAMAEYAAGRMDKAIEGLEAVVKQNPGNASARFQLACLLQDHKKDPLGAICSYREYRMLFPKGDKVKLAVEREAACEAQLARLLVKKHNLGGSVAQDEANERLRADNEKLSKAVDETQKDLDKVRGDLASVRRENERLRRMVLADEGGEEVKGKSEKGKSDESVEGVGEGVATVAKKIPDLPDEKSLLEEQEEGLDRVKFSKDVENLVAEEKDETSEASPFGKTTKRVVEDKSKKPAPEAPLHEKKPDYYVVQEGDTLFKLAMRFYGRRSAWTQIRDANKATISSDNRIKAGQKLRMP